MSEVESELDRHIAAAADAAAAKERSRQEKEKDELRRRLEAEIAEVQENMRELQKLDRKMERHSEREQMSELKSKLQVCTARLTLCMELQQKSPHFAGSLWRESSSAQRFDREAN